MTGKEIQTWMSTRLMPNGEPMEVQFAMEAAQLNRTSFYRWTARGDEEVRPTRALRDFVGWMREYDRDHWASRTKNAPRTPKAIRI